MADESLGRRHGRRDRRRRRRRGDGVPRSKQARAAIRLVMLVNDVSLRGLIPAELAKGFGFYPVEAVVCLLAGRRHAG
ncbi:hypothetical protein [Ensifer canadensis]